MTDISTFISLPKPLTPLVGREAELAKLQEFIQSGQRLTTITGISGIGKTRLAHQIALELEPLLAGGAVVVPLVDVRDAAQVPSKIAKLFGHTETDIDISALARILGADPRLLVLDNLEQIPDVGSMIIALLEQTPGLIVLGTSQVPLEVSGEHLFPLEPMSVPVSGSTSLRDSPAIELFLLRARAVAPHLEFDDDQLTIVADICRLLDGIPLAIELAAARVSILPLQELRARLTNRLDVLGGGNSRMPVRQRTMRSAIAWTYDLLSADDRRVFRYSSVYAGTISFDAIAHTLKSLEFTESPLDVVARLVGWSLIRPTAGNEARYTMLATVREFGHEQLRTEGDEFNARLAHAHYVAEMSDLAELHLVGPSQRVWFDRLGADLENIHTAAAWSVEQRPAIARHIVAKLWRFLEYQGVARRYIELGVRATQALPSPGESVEFHLGMGYLLEGQRLLDEAEASFQRSLDNVRSADHPLAEIRAVIGLGLVAMDRSDTERAKTLLTRASEMASEHGAPREQAVAISNRAILFMYTGELVAARDGMIETLAIFEELDDTVAVAMTLGNLGGCCNLLGEYSEAEMYLLRCVEIDRQTGNIVNLANTFSNLASTCVERGDLDSAETYFNEAIAAAQQANLVSMESEIRVGKVNLHLRQQDMMGATDEIIAAATLAIGEAGARACVSAAHLAMELCVEQGLRQSAAELAGGVHTWRSRLAYPAQETHADRLESMLSSIPECESDPLRHRLTNGEQLSLAELRESTITASTAVRNSLGVLANPIKGPATAVGLVNRLTAREREVLAMVVKGNTNAEIADEMFISLRTVTTHLTNIYTKLDVKNRTSAVSLALDRGLV